jgi:hypothetical protein
METAHELFNINVDVEGYCPLEIVLKSPDDFLKIRETLSRIGVASKTEAVLYQSCHILHKRGRYFLTTFKELFALDGKTTDITKNDIQRRNTIAKLLEDWGLLKILCKDSCGDFVHMSQIKIIPFKEKTNWKLVTKYNIGKRVKPQL